MLTKIILHNIHNEPTDNKFLGKFGKILMPSQDIILISKDNKIIAENIQPTFKGGVIDIFSYFRTGKLLITFNINEEGIPNPDAEWAILPVKKLKMPSAKKQLERLQNWIKE